MPVYVFEGRYADSPKGQPDFAETILARDSSEAGEIAEASLSSDKVYMGLYYVDPDSNKYIDCTSRAYRLLEEEIILHQDRLEAADKVLYEVDTGEETVDLSDEWEASTSDEGNTVFTRLIYLEGGEDGQSETRKVTHVHVTFAPDSASVLSTSIVADGQAEEWEPPAIGTP